MTIIENIDKTLQMGAEDISLVGHKEPQFNFSGVGSIVLIDSTKDCNTREGVPATIKDSIDISKALKKAWNGVLDALTEQGIAIPEFAQSPIQFGINQNIGVKLDSKGITVSTWVMEFDGTENWSYSNSTRLFSIKVNGTVKPGTKIATRYTYGILAGTGSDPDKTIFQYQTTLYVTDYVFSTIVGWKNHLASLKAAGVPLQVVYELNTPIHIDFEKELDLSFVYAKGTDIVALHDIDNNPVYDIAIKTNENGTKDVDIRWNKEWVETNKQFPPTISTVLQTMGFNVDYDMVATMYSQLQKLTSNVNATEQNVHNYVQSYVNDRLSEGQVYGVSHKYEDASPVLTRIGNMDLHKTLPVQSLMRRCLLSDDGVAVYLDENDSTKTALGTDAVLDGSAGQVMVEIPEHYRKFTLDTKNKTYACEISLYPFTGAHRVNRCYISAYEASLDRTNSKLSSVVNTTDTFRGGNNTSSWDGTYRSLLGKPVTSLSLTQFRTYANNRGTDWKCQEWDIYCTLFWLYSVEYANLDCQSTYTSDLTTDGYHQGGLGSGVTNMPSWDTYNSYNPITPCGVTNSLGNNTGVVQYSVLNSSNGVAYNAPVPSYRGVENPFGHIWKWTDGVLAVGNGSTQTYYKCVDRNKYSSSVTSDYYSVGTSPTGNGYKKEIVRNKYGDIFTSAIGGGSTTYFCDYHYRAVAAGTTYGFRSGGASTYSSSAGFGSLASDAAPGISDANIGSRLTYCNEPQIIN